MLQATDTVTEVVGPRAAPVLVGLVGKGIQLSRTPAMHEREGARLGLRYVYRTFDVDQMGNAPPPFSEILRAAELCGFAGLNVTYPYKKEVMEHLDELSDTARAVDAVNTVVFRDGKRFGHNSDMWGFGESFRRTMAGAPRSKVLLIGAGGAGCAVGHALLASGVERLVIVDSDAASTAKLAARLGEQIVRKTAGRARVETAERAADALDGLDGIVNATPMGTAKLPGSPFPVDLLTPALWVADVVYFPIETELLRAARGKGCRTLPGSGMAVFQAVRSFELFTGIRPDSDAMMATFKAFDG